MTKNWTTIDFVQDFEHTLIGLKMSSSVRLFKCTDFSKHPSKFHSSTYTHHKANSDGMWRLWNNKNRWEKNVLRNWISSGCHVIGCCNFCGKIDAKYFFLSKKNFWLHSRIRLTRHLLYWVNVSFKKSSWMHDECHWRMSQFCFSQMFFPSTLGAPFSHLNGISHSNCIRLCHKTDLVWLNMSGCQCHSHISSACCVSKIVRFPSAFSYCKRKEKLSYFPS